MKYPVLIGIVLLAARETGADEIRLKNEGRIVGIASDQGDRVEVQLGCGTAWIRKSEVEAIVPWRTALHEYGEKFQALGDNASAADYFRLALSARSENLSRYVRPLLERVIALDPDHEGARDLLGYMRLEGRWLTKPEYLEATGHLFFRGTWVKIEERDKTLARESEEVEKRRQEAARRRAEKTAYRMVEPPFSSLGLRPYRARGLHRGYVYPPWHGFYVHSPGHFRRAFHHGARHVGHHGH